MENQKKQVFLPPEIHKMIKVAAAKKGILLKDALEQAILKYAKEDMRVNNSN